MKPVRSQAIWLLVILAGTFQVHGDTAAEAVQESGKIWVTKTLDRLTLEQKAAQLVMVPAIAAYSSPQGETFRELRSLVADLGVGGVIFFDADLESMPRLANDLQHVAEVPLLVASDFERGVAFRVRRGAVDLPYAMAFGAADSIAAARFLGEVTAREGRALGIHWTFAPVADVNSNPRNPIINLRSFGEDPRLVADMVAAFIYGAQQGSMLSTVKHFPGHGDTDADSHVTLPTILADRERLDAVELVPFRRAIEAGVDAVMLGHIAVPAFDPSGAPATLSRVVASDLLRDQLGFQGLIVTDAMDMEGVCPSWTGGAAIRAVQAGTDVVLMPPDPRVAVQSLVRAVREGQLSEARLNASVRRVLEAKARLGLHEQRRVDLAKVGTAVARPEDVQRALEIARASITIVRNEGDVLPLVAEKPLRLLHVMLSSRVQDRFTRGVVERELERRRVDVETRHFGPEISAETIAELESASGFTHVLVSAFARVTSSQISPSHAHLLKRLQTAGHKVIVTSFGSPYLLGQFPEMPVYVCAYGPAISSQRAVIAALFGEFDVRGKLPVTLPGLYDIGHGIELSERDMTLREATPEEAGFRADGLRKVDRVVEDFIAQGAFPGAVVAVGHRGRLAHLRAYGRLGYDDDAADTTVDTIYDLASLTKVIATTTMAMILIDEGKLELDTRVVDVLPNFQGEAKERATVRHLLTHSSGIDWWAPLFQELSGQEAYVERIQAMDLVAEPGTRVLYSDLGLILLGVILERVAGEPLDAFIARRVFEPLGMDDTQYLPGEDLRPRIAPTENDPWRGRVLRGEVHDENAFALGGIAPHAGLFGTADDLARFAQMILNGGVFDHQRIVSRSTVELFTRRASVVAESTRALGWDTKSAEKSSAGELFSADSFGHTGFTGTSLWIDPQRQLFLVLLTNRVHPSRDNQLIRQARPAVANAVVEALMER